MKLEINFISFS